MLALPPPGLTNGRQHRQRCSFRAQRERPEPDDFLVQPGVRVRHPRWGVGIVNEVGAGSNPTVTVQFPGSRPKRIKLSFLSLV